MIRTIIILLLMPCLTFADKNSDIDITQSNDQNLQSTGDVNVGTGDSRAWGFGHSMGDVDIAQCLGSTQWDTILGGQQKLVLNNVCMAEFYLKNEKWGLAAMALCNQPEILKEFGSEAECEAAHDFAPAEIEVPASGPSITCEIEHEEVSMVVEEQQMELETIEQRLARIESGQRAAAAKRRQSAMQTMEKLQNDPEN